MSLASCGWLPGAEVAELAVTVRDVFQARGLGRALLTGLVAAAAERGIRRRRLYLLYENRPARSLLEHSVWQTSFENQGTVVAAELEVPAGPVGAHEPRAGSLEDELEEPLRMIARGAVVSPLSLSLLGVRSWWRSTERLLTALVDADR